jgi:spermidine/putrescine transport system substrate-binding protein
MISRTVLIVHKLKRFSVRQLASREGFTKGGNRMRQKLLIVLAILVIVALSACAGSPTATQPEPTDTEAAVVTEDTEVTEGADLTEEVASEEVVEEEATEDAATEEILTKESETEETTEEADTGSRTVETDEADEATDESVEMAETEEAEATEETNATDEVSSATEDAAGGATDEVVAAGDLAIPTSWTCPEGFEGQTLSIYNWATFIGDNTVPVFEELCGVTVEYTIYESDEALISRLQQGNPGFDLAFPTDYAVSILIRQGLLSPINLDNVPNFANINPAVTNQQFDPNNEHSVPYVLGTTGIAYNVEAFPDGLPTWESLFNAEGRIAWLESPRSMIGAALLQLGYDPNTTDLAQIEEARDYLIEHGDNVVTVAADDGDALLVQGEVDAVVEYGGDVYQQLVDCACDDFSFSNPVDGPLLDITSVVILADAPNQPLAEVFIDYLSDPAVAAHNTNQLGYGSPNQAAIEAGLIDPAISESPALTLSPEAEENAWFVEDIGDDDILYTQAWDEVKVNLGN